MHVPIAHRTYGYCPECYRVVSLKQGACHHCGRRFGGVTAKQAGVGIAQLLWLMIWVAGVVAILVFVDR